MESGPKYAICKEGLIKLIVIALGCVTFAMIADTHYYRSSRMQWVFAAFIISFAVSVLIYIFRITGASRNMSTCGPCTFDGFDFLWSWFSTIWCLAAAVAFATVFPRLTAPFSSGENKLIVAIVFAFLTGIGYAVEAYILRDKAPANLGYISTRKGWLKTILVALGAATFGLLVDSGYNWCRYSSCHGGITYALVAYIIGWVVTLIIWIIHISGQLPANSRGGFQKFEFIWSVICVLLFLSASACFAAFMGCRGNDFGRYKFCQMRLAGVIIGFMTGILYIVDAVMNKP